MCSDSDPGDTDTHTLHTSDAHKRDECQHGVRQPATALASFSAIQSDVGRKRVGGSGLLLLHNLSLLNLKSPPPPFFSLIHEKLSFPILLLGLCCSLTCLSRKCEKEFRFRVYFFSKSWDIFASAPPSGIFQKIKFWLTDGVHAGKIF